MTVPGGYVAGDTLSAANMNLLPGGKMGYAQITADQTAITTLADVTSLTVTWTAVSARRYRISVFANGLIQTDASATQPTIYITDGSNNKKQTIYGQVIDIGGVPDLTGLAYMSMYGAVCETGLSGSTTRKVRAESVVSFDIKAASTAPCYILVEDIGPA